MNIRSKLSSHVSLLLLTTFLPLLAGCGDALTGPEPARPVEARSAAVTLLTPDGSRLIVAIKGGPDVVETSEGDMWFQMHLNLLQDGRAAGTAGLLATDRSRGYLFEFVRGDIVAEDPMVVQLEAVMHEVPVGAPLRGIAREETPAGERVRFVITETADRGEADDARRTECQNTLKQLGIAVGAGELILRFTTVAEVHSTAGSCRS